MNLLANQTDVVEVNEPMAQQEVIDDLVARKKAGAFGARVQEANERYQQSLSDKSTNNAIIDSLKESAEKTYNYLTGEEVPIAQQKQYQEANEIADWIGQNYGQDGLSFTSGDVRSEIIKNKGIGAWSNLNTLLGGRNGLSSHYDNPELVQNIRDSYKAKQAKAQEDAAAAAQAEADKDITLEYGEGDAKRSYTISKANADEIKRLAAISSNANAPENLRKQATAQLITALEAAGYKLPEGTDLTKLVNSEALLKAVSEGEGGLDRYLDLVNILQEAERDRTPKEPEKKSWEELYFERQARQAEIDREREQRRIQGERLGRGIGDLAATIGDMVRASEGAPVSQRDWQRIYDNLTAQEKANVNNYQVRMAKLRQEVLAERARQQAAAAAAAEKAAERQHDWQKLNANLTFKGKEGALERQLKWDIANLKDKKDRYYYYLRWGQGGANDKSKTHTLILLGDKAMMVPKSQTFTNAFNAIKEILTKESNYLETAKDENGKFPKVSLLQSVPELETDPQAYYNRNIQAILSENWNDLTPTAKAAIEKKLKAMQGEWVTGTPSDDYKSKTKEDVDREEAEDEEEVEDRLG